MIFRRPRTTHEEPFKPFLRGKFHRYGFYTCFFLGIIVLILAKNTIARISFLIYLISVLLVYGVSSTYHLTNWKTHRTEAIMQKLDHACIYLLIAGTYTPVCTLCLPFDQRWSFDILKIVWFIATLGIIRSIFFTNIPKIVNVIFYLTMGFVIVPFMPKVFKHVDASFAVFFIFGGIIYSFGGLVYGFENPDPVPHIFGFHELFHLCTVLGNLCFAVPIVIKTLK